MTDRDEALRQFLQLRVMDRNDNRVFEAELTVWNKRVFHWKEWGLAANGCIQREAVASEGERLGGAGGCSAHRIAQSQYSAACICAENDPIL